uniref:EthD domain-containing protein n=1 Tax=Streptomyces sp. 8L TaxID=2877242 RepID=UPI001CD1F279|nr:EthD domain-containing protein [Streptomyces sp. 8L]MCA1221020.1 EthD domain-containing protein [Streptomyces sp. 8L]
MITTIALLKAKDGLTRDEFIRYYENHHVPLILSLAPAPAYYVRNYLPVVGDRAFPADFDVMTQLGFADEAVRQQWLDLVLAPASGVAEDEARFLDRTQTRSWIVEEYGSRPNLPGQHT